MTSFVSTGTLLTNDCGFSTFDSDTPDFAVHAPFVGAVLFEMTNGMAAKKPNKPKK